MKITAVCSPLLLVSWLVQQTYHSLNVYFKIYSGADPENSDSGGQKNFVQAIPKAGDAADFFQKEKKVESAASLYSPPLNSALVSDCGYKFS